MSKEQEAAELRAKAANYRALGRQISDDETSHEILAFAADLEQKARDMERGRIRGQFEK